MKLRHTSLYSALALVVIAGLPFSAADAGIVKLVFNNSTRAIGLSQLNGQLIQYFNHSSQRFLQLRLSEPLLCGEFPNGASSNVRVRLLDANGDVIANNNTSGVANTFGSLTEISGSTGGIRLLPVAGGEERLQLNTTSELNCVVFDTFLTTGETASTGKAAGYELRVGTDPLSKAINGGDSIFADGFEQLVASPIDVLTSIAAPSTVRAGQNYVYTVTVRNNGSSALSNIQVRDFFYKRSSQPGGSNPVLEDGSWTCQRSDTAACSGGTGVIYANGISLAAGGQISFTATRLVNNSPTPNAGTNFSVAAAAFVNPNLNEPISSNNAAIANAQIVVTQPPVIANLPATLNMLEDQTSAAQPFTLSDPDTSVSALSVSGSSNATAIISNAGINLGGSGASRTLTLTPVADANGQATVTVSVNDGSNTTTANVTATVTAVNDAPSFTWKDNCTVSNGGTWTPESGPASGQFTYPAGSQNTQNCSGFVIANAGPNEADVMQSVAITSIVNQGVFAELPTLTLKNNSVLLFFRPNGTSGTATVNVQITDSGGTANGGQNTSAIKSFRVRVEGAAPSVSPISNQIILEDGSTGALPFTIGDTDTPVGNLQITTSSTNTTLTPPGSIVIGGSGANRSIQITPVANGFGNATITLSVSDGDQVTNRVFDLTVNPVNDAPSFTSLGNQSFASGVASGTKQVAGWASNLVMGPANESDQVPDLFVVERIDTNVPNIMGGTPPSVSLVSTPIGRLTFPLASNGSGVAIDGYACYRVSLFDSGASDAPNVNESAPVILKIQVGPGTFTCPLGRSSEKNRAK